MIKQVFEIRIKIFGWLSYNNSFFEGLSLFNFPRTGLGRLIEKTMLLIPT